MSKRSGIMLCFPLEEKRLLRWNTPTVIVQPKLDGERCRAIPVNSIIESSSNQWTLLSSECNPFVSIPHIQAWLNSLGKAGWPELDGELYVHGWDFSQIHSVASREVNLHPDHEQLELHVFDCMANAPQKERLLWLTEYLGYCDLPNFIKIVPSFIIPNSLDSIYERYEQFLEQGYEGIIVRHPQGIYERKRSNFIMKFKPKKCDHYTIVGLVEERDKNGVPKGTLGSFECLANKGEGTFTVGSGLTQQQRVEYWDAGATLINRTVVVKYQSINPSGAPRFPIFIEVV